MARKKFKTLDDRIAALEAQGLKAKRRAGKVVAREVPREHVAKEPKAPPPSYDRRKAELAARRAVAERAGRRYSEAFKAYGAVAYDTALGDGKRKRGRGGYYTGRAAALLLKLGDDPNKAHARKEIFKDYISSQIPGKRGKYRLKIEGVLQKKIYTWREVKAFEEARYWEKKIALVSDRTGATKEEVRALLKKIEGQEARKVRRYKGTKKFKKLSGKAKRRVTIKNRMRAIFGAMTDLLQVYGSPKTEGTTKNGDEILRVRHGNDKPKRARRGVPATRGKRARRR